MSCVCARGMVEAVKRSRSCTMRRIYVQVLLAVKSPLQRGCDEYSGGEGDSITDKTSPRELVAEPSSASVRGALDIVRATSVR